MDASPGVNLMSRGLRTYIRRRNRTLFGAVRRLDEIRPLRASTPTRFLSQSWFRLLQGADDRLFHQIVQPRWRALPSSS